MQRAAEFSERSVQEGGYIQDKDICSRKTEKQQDLCYPYVFHIDSNRLVK